MTAARKIRLWLTRQQLAYVQAMPPGSSQFRGGPYLIFCLLIMIAILLATIPLQLLIATLPRKTAFILMLGLSFAFIPVAFFGWNEARKDMRGLVRNDPGHWQHRTQTLYQRIRTLEAQIG